MGIGWPAIFPPGHGRNGFFPPSAVDGGAWAGGWGRGDRPRGGPVFGDSPTFDRGGGRTLIFDLRDRFSAFWGTGGWSLVGLLVCRWRVGRWGLRAGAEIGGIGASPAVDRRVFRHFSGRISDFGRLFAAWRQGGFARIFGVWRGIFGIFGSLPSVPFSAENTSARSGVSPNCSLTYTVGNCGSQGKYCDNFTKYGDIFPNSWPGMGLGREKFFEFFEWSVAGGQRLGKRGQSWGCGKGWSADRTIGGVIGDSSSERRGETFRRDRREEAKPGRGGWRATLRVGRGFVGRRG
jgi:hypothetical protein